jgi:hypothetical protein
MRITIDNKSYEVGSRQAAVCEQVCLMPEIESTEAAQVEINCHNQYVSVELRVRRAKVTIPTFTEAVKHLRRA